MATVNQIYALVNDSAKEAMGAQAISVKDTASLVSLGNVIMASDTNKEQFYKSLVDRIGRTVIAIRSYAGEKRSVKRDELEWGVVYQKISFKDIESSTNPTWDASNQANPFDVAIKTEVTQKLFSKMGTWQYEDSIPDAQLFTAFTNASAMGAFIAGIYTNIDNAMTQAFDNLANLAVDTYMAGVMIGGKTTQKRNLLSEYNTLASSTLTVAQALRNLDFLKYATREIQIVTDNMTKKSYLYNATTDISRFTPSEKLVVEVLGQFASACDSYLQADTYHNNLVALPNYEKVTYWQGAGTSFGFSDVSKINIENVELATDTNLTGAVEQGGIVAFVHDYDAVASIIYKKRNRSIYNPRAERINIFHKAETGYAVDLSENGVVFYMAEPVTP